MFLSLVILLSIFHWQYAVAYFNGYSDFSSENTPGGESYGYPNPFDYPTYLNPPMYNGYTDYYAGHKLYLPYGYPNPFVYPILPNSPMYYGISEFYLGRRESAPNSELTEYPVYPNPLPLPNQPAYQPPLSPPGCGRYISNTHDTIFKGKPSMEGQWPWQVSLYKYSMENDKFESDCGGSLINEMWFVTAAHCFITEKPQLQILSPDEFELYFGKYSRREYFDNKYVQKRQIAKIYLHPRYDVETSDNDIALIRMDQPVQFNERVQPVCMPAVETTNRHVRVGNKGVITGFGEKKDGEPANRLQQAVIPVISIEQCRDIWTPQNRTVSDNMFCAGYLDAGRSPATCFGDSGGPMVFLDNTAEEKKWVLEGVTSWGPQICGIPATIYTRVSNYMGWISRKILS